MRVVAKIWKLDWKERDFVRYTNLEKPVGSGLGNFDF